MELSLPFGAEKLTFEAPWPPANLAIAKRPARPIPSPYTTLAENALAAPIGELPLDEIRLKGREIAILIDVGPRAVPADVLTVVLDRLNAAGADDDRIEIIAACGLQPPTPRQVELHLGEGLAARVRWSIHDPFAGKCKFRGFTALGTPVFVNEKVAAAGFRVAIGQVQPHATRGYSGGHDAILPMACSVETILRNQNLGFGPLSSYGRLGDNPCRLDVENAGRAAELDYVLDFVVTPESMPDAAFAGEPVKAQRAAANHGDRAVWGAELGGLADAAIASPGHDWTGEAPFEPYAIEFAAAGVRPGGSIAFLASPGMMPLADDEWERDLLDLRLDKLARLYERRNWSGEAHEVAGKLSAIGRAFLTIRPFHYRSVILVGSDLPAPALERLGAGQVETIGEAVDILLERHGDDARIALVPDASTTLCLPEAH